MKTRSYSLVARLSKRQALFTVVVLGLLYTASWYSVSSLIIERSQQDLTSRTRMLTRLLLLEARSGGVEAVRARLVSDAPMRTNARIELDRNGQSLYADAPNPAIDTSSHKRTQPFSVPLAGGTLQGRYTVDFAADARVGVRSAWLLTLLTLAAGGVAAFGTFWNVRRALHPLRELAAQTRAMSPRHPQHRLSVTDPAEELLPWVEQFNALMDRQQLAYTQLEGFNADVAHELRTPLATLIGQTEVALARERSPEALREVLASNLEETQRLAAMVNDMLFLSQADRGATARRGQPVSLAALAAQVIEFHEAAIQEAGLRLRIDGDATLPVDEPLFKRALSNLLGNATRYADAGSTVLVRIAAELAQTPQQVEVVVQNRGRPIAPQQLPRLFDRFYRGENSRSWLHDQPHHGLGLAIVAAIARMHAGRTLAESDAGSTRIGFTLARR